MAPTDRPVAVIAPSLRSIKLYADGRIDYQGKSGSVIGATARIERSGERHGLRDARKVVLRIDGPSVAIAVPLPVNAVQLQKHAEEFVAQVNELSNEADGSAPTPPAEPSAAPTAAAGAGDADLRSMDVRIGQLERLGKLRDSGVLTEDEFQQQKTAVLRAKHSS